MHLFQGLLSYLNGEAGKYFSECLTHHFFKLNQIKLLYFTLCWLSKDGNKIQRKWPVKRHNIWLLLTCCLCLLILLDTSSSIDKSVPLEMPNQRSAAAQAQGIWSICFYTSLALYFIRLHRFSLLWLLIIIASFYKW